MGIIRTITVATLLVATFGVPAMACLKPAQPMTPAEHECCRRMSRECGSMSGSAAHSCCRAEARPSSPFVGVSHFVLNRHAVQFGAAAIRAALMPMSLADIEVSAISHSPPALASTVLRI